LEVIVQLEGKAAREFAKVASSSEDIVRLRRVLARLGVILRPQQPGIDDAELSRYFVGEVRDRDEGSRVAAALTALPVVTAAYAKPPAELP
jgi:hypothetical protein